jgi:CheY-like chemotaxis protein
MDRSRVVILVADDEELVRNMIAIIVRSDGYHVLIASDGVEALDLSRRYHGHIDLLISDILMPGMTGIELAKVLTKERPTIKVMLVSGSTEEPIPAGCHFLAKPFTTGAMRQAVVNLLAPAG